MNSSLHFWREDNPARPENRKVFEWGDELGGVCRDIIRMHAEEHQEEE